MTLGTRLFTWLNGERVGTDSFGNHYYREKKRRALVKGGGFNSRERRWVIYSGRAEATKVPAEWHGWISCPNRALCPAGRGRRNINRI